MALLTHALEVATLLGLTFVAGWGAGFGARSFFSRGIDRPVVRATVAPAVPAEPLAAIAAVVEPPGRPALPATRPGFAWDGDLNGRSAARLAVAPQLVPSAGSEPAPVLGDAGFDEYLARRAVETGPGPRSASGQSAAAPRRGGLIAAADVDGTSPVRARRPFALPEPRRLGKDRLTRIIGLDDDDEAVLNRLGIFHFDQIAAWREAELVWLEAKTLDKGRVGREEWREQARILAQRQVDGGTA